MKKLLLFITIALASAGSAQGMSRYEEWKQSMHRLKAMTLASDTIFFFSAASLVHAAMAAVPATSCVAVPAAICGKAVIASAGLPIVGTFFSGIFSTATRIVTLIVRAEKASAKSAKYF